MYLTDSIEVFVVRPNQPHEYTEEYVCKTQHTAFGQSYIAVKDREDYFICIVFGKDFSVSPLPASLAPDMKISVCRITVVIDSGIAFNQRICRLDNARTVPHVQNIPFFESARLAASGAVRQYQPHFAALPKMLPFGMEMPSALRKMLGHIDVELERGYLAHFQRPDVHTLQLEHIPDAFDSQYSVNYTRTSCYRTKLICVNGQKSSQSNEVFIATEPKKCLRIYYCDEGEFATNVSGNAAADRLQDMIKLGLSKHKIMRRAHSASWLEAIQALRKSMELTIGKTPTFAADAHLSTILKSLRSKQVRRAGYQNVTAADSSAEEGKASSRKMDDSHFQLLESLGEDHSNLPPVSTSHTPFYFLESSSKDTPTEVVEPAKPEKQKSNMASLSDSLPNTLKDVGMKRSRITSERILEANTADITQNNRSKTMTQDSGSEKAQTKLTEEILKDVSVIDLTLEPETNTRDEDSRASKQLKGLTKDNRVQQLRSQVQPSSVAQAGFDWRKAQKQLRRLRGVHEEQRTSKNKQPKSNKGEPQSLKSATKLSNTATRNTNRQLYASTIEAPRGLSKTQNRENSTFLTKAGEEECDEIIILGGSEITVAKPPQPEYGTSPRTLSTFSKLVTPTQAFTIGTQLPTESNLLNLPFQQLESPRYVGSSQQSDGAAVRLPQQFYAETARSSKRRRRSKSSSPRPGGNDSDLKLKLAKYQYEILQAETVGLGRGKEVIRKRIQLQQYQIQLAEREIARLHDMLPEPSAIT